MGFKNWICDAWCRILSVLFTDVLPVLSFGSVVSFRWQQTYLRLTLFGYAAAVLICLLLLRRGKAFVDRLPHGIRRGLLRSAFTALLWIVGLGIFLFGVHMANKLLRWWIFVGACFLVGRIFALLDEIKQS